jgi:hypothetical protein
MKNLMMAMVVGGWLLAGGCAIQPLDVTPAACYDVNWRPLPANQCGTTTAGCADERVYRYGVNDACFPVVFLTACEAALSQAESSEEMDRAREICGIN